MIIHRDNLALVNLFDVMTKREKEIEDDKKNEALLAAFQLEETEKEPYTTVVKYQPTLKQKEDKDDDDDEDKDDESSDESGSSRSSSYKSSLNQSLTKAPTIKIKHDKENNDPDNNSSRHEGSKRNQEDNSERNDKKSAISIENHKIDESRKALKKGKNTPKDSSEKKGGSERSLKAEKSSESESQSSKQGGESISQASLNTEQSEDKFSIKYNKNTRVPLVIGFYKQMDKIKYKKYCKWSGQDVIAYTPYDPEKAVYICDLISKICTWEKGLSGYMAWLERFIRRFFKHPIINTFLTILVLANTVILCLDRYTQPESEDKICGIINNVFTYIFAVEVFCKLFAYGFRRYLSDVLNWFDITVVIISLIEIVISGGGASAISAMRAIRLLRTLRVLRVTRFIKSLQTMRMIVDVLSRSISSFAYIGFLLIIFICIFTLLGKIN